MNNKSILYRRKLLTTPYCMLCMMKEPGRIEEVNQTKRWTVHTFHSNKVCSATKERKKIMIAVYYISCGTANLSIQCFIDEQENSALVECKRHGTGSRQVMLRRC